MKMRGEDFHSKQSMNRVYAGLRTSGETVEKGYFESVQGGFFLIFEIIIYSCARVWYLIARHQ